MFTGIVTELGRVQAVQRRAPGAALHVACGTTVEDARVGDSIAVNGVCLTVTELGGAGCDDDGGGFVAEVMGETLERSALGHLAAGDPVNLEPALRAGGRLGGHLVQGHVDATAEVVAIEEQGGGGGGWTVLTVALPPPIAPYVVEKGSIAIDGVSLTVMAVDAASFAIGLIPHTLAVTTLGAREPGDLVNLEVDVVAKYVERMLRAGTPTPYAAGHPQPATTEEV